MSLQENLTPEELAKQPPWVHGSIIFSTVAELIEKAVKENGEDVIKAVMGYMDGAFQSLVYLYPADKEQLLADTVRLIDYVTDQLKEIPEPYVQDDPIPDMGLSHADIFGDLTDLPDDPNFTEKQGYVSNDPDGDLNEYEARGN
jgi:hypothetical protein